MPRCSSPPVLMPVRIRVGFEVRVKVRVKVRVRVRVRVRMPPCSSNRVPRTQMLVRVKGKREGCSLPMGPR